MWGGLKSRKNYADVFKQWSPTKAVEDVRVALFKEPRPWHLVYGLHEHLQYLTDHHCSRLLSWCTTTVQLTSHTHQMKRRAYRYSQEAFNVMLHSHKVDEKTFYEYFRLCAAGRDLTAAQRLYEFWNASSRPGAGSITTLTWMLRLAALSPCDDRVNEVVRVAVSQYRLTRGSGATEKEDETVSCHQAFISCLSALQPRVREDTELLGWISSIIGCAAPKALEAEDESAERGGWPTVQHHHTFPCLEAGEGHRGATSAAPLLRDSILHPSFVKALQDAAFHHRVKSVIELVKHFEQEVAQEREVMGGRSSSTRSSGTRRRLWRQDKDPSAMRFREKVVAGGGLTPELYHYIVVALSFSHPSSALRTMERMKASNLRVLDLTRAVLLTRVGDSPEDQYRLFAEQLDAVEERERLDADHQVNTALECYWKFDYVNFFHYRNGLNREDFLFFLMKDISPVSVQELLLRYERSRGLLSSGSESLKEEDLIVLDASLRRATERFLSTLYGATSVNHFLDWSTARMPQLDISLMGAIPYFDHYALPSHDTVATDVAALRENFARYNAIYVLDASFIETSERYLRLGQHETFGQQDSPSLVLFPYPTLRQLALSVRQGNEEELDNNERDFFSFDSTLQDEMKEEARLASQRLQSIFNMISARRTQAYTSSPDDSPDPSKALPTARVLHLTECMLAHALDLSSLKKLDLDPVCSDNDKFILVLSLIRMVAAPGAKVILCSDDSSLNKKLERVMGGTTWSQASPSTPPPSHALFSGNIDILSSPAPAHVVEADGDVRLDDNPLLPVDLETFTPVLSAPVIRSMQETQEHTMESLPALDIAPSSSSPWLDLLDEDVDQTVMSPSLTEPPRGSAEVQEEEEEAASGATRSAEESSQSGVDFGGATNTNTAVELSRIPSSPPAETGFAALYDSPHSVVPLREYMTQASAPRSVFHEFDVLEPHEEEAKEEERAASASTLSLHGMNASRRGNRNAPRFTLLLREKLANRGYSQRVRARLARRLSNQSGGRVPFNLKYRVVEADIHDSRNRPLLDLYRKGVERKRNEFHRKHWGA